MNDLIDMLLMIQNNDIEQAKRYANSNYPFAPIIKDKRQYTRKQMFEVFMRDKFCDRYSGEKLYNPGILKMLNYFMPKEFPYHQHGKVEECHLIFWDLLPSIDHVVPLGRGGCDSFENWVTTSQKKNMIKNNWSLEDVGWKLRDIENSDWDGGTSIMLEIFNSIEIKDNYINDWCKIALAYNSNR